MPINLPADLPAARILDDENIFYLTQERAVHQDIRPLEIVLLNLMPTKIETETQIVRLLGNSPLQVDLVLLHPSTYVSKNTSPEHLLNFYTKFNRIRDRKFDGLIITGAPVENMDFKDVKYYSELKQIMDWSRTNVTSTFHICWGAQAGLYHHYGIGKYPLERKCFGVFEHKVTMPNEKLFRGFDDVFFAPHSRHTEVRMNDILESADVDLLSYSDEAGMYIAASKDRRQIFVTGHSEYDRDTLKREYFRDKQKGLPIDMPLNYFPCNDDTKQPLLRWRSHANLLYVNWLNYYVYQETPYDLNRIG
jgi:homoserine O-succinyltransferase/O-acetyltransferase